MQCLNRPGEHNYKKNEDLLPVNIRSCNAPHLGAILLATINNVFTASDPLAMICGGHSCSFYIRSASELFNPKGPLCHHSLLINHKLLCSFSFSMANIYWHFVDLLCTGTRHASGRLNYWISQLLSPVFEGSCLEYRWAANHLN